MTLSQSTCALSCLSSLSLSALLGGNILGIDVGAHTFLYMLDMLGFLLHCHQLRNEVALGANITSFHPYRFGTVVQRKNGNVIF